MVMNDLTINLKGIAYSRKHKYHFAVTCGVFDLFHKGHKDLLELLALKGKKTIIFLHDDLSTYKNKDKFPVQNFKQRSENLYQTGLVDYIFKVEAPDPSEKFEFFLEKASDKKIIYVRGNDWKDAPGLEVFRDYRIKILYKKYTKGISSSKLRDKLNK